ncbi:MAG: hypothetical protein ACI97X_000740 [Oceanospirillaceae bacterium]|jgi:hypothetical protein
MISGNVVYITAQNPLLCGGCLSPPLNASQGNASNSNDNATTSLAVTFTQGSMQPVVNCWDNFEFNTTTCAWDNTGTQDAESAMMSLQAIATASAGQAIG